MLVHEAQSEEPPGMECNYFSSLLRSGFIRKKGPLFVIGRCRRRCFPFLSFSFASFSAGWIIIAGSGHIENYKPLKTATLFMHLCLVFSFLFRRVHVELRRQVSLVVWWVPSCRCVALGMKRPAVRTCTFRPALRMWCMLAFLRAIGDAHFVSLSAWRLFCDTRPSPLPGPLLSTCT